ncbi:MAG: type II toxin-antitoxin system RelE/ParE family toxin [Chitinophagaceae bacterium]|jgi:plasmid stabilization system protein ParE|nr:type II toxin-antitoxin system RelE/ParE family toxin [Chitinophagaceae bacterium]MBP9740301.1 type II toxin-antitoxin system RelE/ParE family toxin [Chitinophagaceae bacterium]
MALRKKEVVLSLQATDDLEAIYAYLFEEWGIQVLQKFVDEFKNFILLIAYQPRSFGYLNKPLNLRKYTLYKHNLVVYKNGKNAVEIIAILNSHQKPSSIKKVIRKRMK